MHFNTGYPSFCLSVYLSDMVEKHVLAERIRGSQIPPADIKPLINQYILEQWQVECQNNKLFGINPVVGKRSIYPFKSRHDQVVWDRPY